MSVATVFSKNFLVCTEKSPILHYLTAKLLPEVHMAKRGRPKGTGKPPGEKYVLKAFKFPPELWEAFTQVVPASERSERIRSYVEREVKIAKRATHNATGAAAKRPAC
jgi:hypothetical protein